MPSRSEPDPAADRIAIVACGALGGPLHAIIERRGWAVDVHPLNPLLHNSPQDIAGAAEALIAELRPKYARVVIGYADCGTYGALDEVCVRLGVPRLAGASCYDTFAGDDAVAGLFADEPGTYLLTDYLVSSFHRSVVRELGLDRWPDLRDDYFGHYRRVVWLRQTEDADEAARLGALARQAAETIGLPLQVRKTGVGGLERGLEALLEAARPAGDR